MRSGVLSVGTAVVDYTKKIDHLPELESLVLIDEITRSTGGPGLNLAFDVRQLDPGLPVEIVACLGQDSEGQFILDQAAQYGIDTSRMQFSPSKSSGYADALTLNSNGKRTFLFHAGSNEDLDVASIDLSQSRARILHLGALGLHKWADSPTADEPSQWVELLKRARSLGFESNMEMVQLDPQRAHELITPCLPHLSSLIINESEAGALLGISAKVEGTDAPLDWEFLESMATSLMSLGIAKIAVIHTPAGAVAADSTGSTWRQGSVKIPDAEINGTTGAGDAFAAGVLYGLHENWEISRCLRLGVATASQNIQSHSTSLGVKPAEQTLAEADTRGYR
jgi:sugar/nucleoside kinase (ribokinase family)